MVSATDAGDVSRLRPLAWIALVLGLGLVGGGVALLTVVEGPSTYESSATLLIDQPQAISIAEDAGLIEKLGRLRFKYAGLVTTAQFAGRVADDVGIDEPTVRRALFSLVDPNSLLLQVGARGTDRARTSDVANTAADALVQYVEEEQEQADVPDVNRFHLTVVTPASEARPLPDPMDRYGLAAALAGGLLVLGGVVGLIVLPRRG